MMWEMLADVIAACLLGLPFICLILLIRIDERVDKINCNLVYELERTRDHLRTIIRVLSEDDDEAAQNWDVYCKECNNQKEVNNEQRTCNN